MKDLQVTIETGKLQGIHGWDPRVAVFKGIPYAAAPVGKLRWKSPQPAEKWEGVRMADRYAPIAMQGVPGSNPDEFWTHEMHPTGPEFAMSEDCLYLNVYTPARTGEEKLPVLMYIHGGGFRGGYPFEIEFDWEHMALKGIVVVSISYRLGVLGYLVHPWLTEEAPDAPKGNYGIEDQLAALKWIHRNIEAFGGDSEQITIAGQSAGAMSVQNLMTATQTEGLISGAIIESSITASFTDKPRLIQIRNMKEKEQVGIEYFEKAGIKSLEEARALPAKRIIELEDEIFGPGVHFEPVIDHILIHETNQEAYLGGRYENIPVIAGYNRGESKNFEPGPKTVEELKAYAKAFGEKAEEFLALCNVQNDEDVEKIFDSNAMREVVAGTRMFGYIQAAHGRKSYLYEFNADIPGEDNAGSYHGSEMWFAYDSLARCWRPFKGKHYDLARQMSSYWINFVKTGDPNGTDTIGEELPEWKSFDPQNQFVMEFTDVPQKSHVEIDPLMKFRISHTLGWKID